MADFGFVTEQLKTEEVATMTLGSVIFPGMEEPATLTGRIAGESNRPFALALAKLTIQKQKMMQGAAVNAEMAIRQSKRNRDDDRQLYADHVITGWGNVTDAKGKPVGFDAETCLQLFKSLPDDVFDQVRNYFATASNFRNQISDDDVKEKGKRSPGA